MNTNEKLRMYREHKDVTAAEPLYDNGGGSVLPYKACMGALRTLGYRCWFDCAPKVQATMYRGIPQQETAVSSLLVAVLDENSPPGRRHLALSVLESLCPQYGLEEMLLPLPPHQLTLFLQALLAQGTDSPHYRSLLDKLLSALEDAAVSAPVKRAILLYLTRVAEARADLLSRGACLCAIDNCGAVAIRNTCGGGGW
ncbi:hypothetical protein HPB49_022655 [Dermacentor silvarum]|uniref:Uncharacterized protein n=1 Tax=Dermacentor silvarum TaxID=543639 RepID=A0ACB8CTI8_DERSI|nr:hypothetical protein HPB49_022655 [Dermacentor silvarum]